MKWCFIIAISIYCIINYMNIENIIVSKNINRNNARPTDYIYIDYIASEDSYQVLKERLQDKNITKRERLEILNILQRLKKEAKDLSWQEFNISKYKVQKSEIDLKQLNSEIKILKREIYEESIIIY